MSVEVVERRDIKELGTTTKRIEEWVHISPKGTRVGIGIGIRKAFDGALDGKKFEFMEENGEIVLIPSEKGRKMKLRWCRRWDGLPTCYYIAVPKEFREKLKSLQNPYVVAENGRIVFKQKTDEEIDREELNYALKMLYKSFDRIHELDEIIQKDRERGLPTKIPEFVKEMHEDSIIFDVANRLSEFYDEIDPAVI